MKRHQGGYYSFGTTEYNNYVKVSKSPRKSKRPSKTPKKQGRTMKKQSRIMKKQGRTRSNIHRL